MQLLQSRTLLVSIFFCWGVVYPANVADVSRLTVAVVMVGLSGFYLAVERYALAYQYSTDKQTVITEYVVFENVIRIYVCEGAVACCMCQTGVATQDDRHRERNSPPSPPMGAGWNNGREALSRSS